MASRIKALSDHAYTLTTFLTVSYYLIVMLATTQSDDHCALAFVNVAVTIATGALLLCWLVWALYVYIKKVPVKAMAKTPRIIIDSVSTILFVYWFAACWWHILIFSWIIPVATAIYIVTIAVAFLLPANKAIYCS